jgi:mannose-1-phosphate guanylyltransferase
VLHCVGTGEDAPRPMKEDFVRFALVLAGGSGTRLWPMSRRGLPKQLIPFVGGKSLLELALDRLDGLAEPGMRYVCAAEEMRHAVRAMVPAIPDEQYIGEPTGRDTLAALALSAEVIRLSDPDAVIGVFPADQVIEPVDEFRRTLEAGFRLVESDPRLLLTFGITPTRPATGYGYLELGTSLAPGSRAVTRFREKPDAENAARFLAAGPDQFLWNSGMFAWKASTFLSCVQKYQPELASGIKAIASAWGTPRRVRTLAEVYPGLKRISVDFGVMEPASVDPQVQVAALPMGLDWKDVGSWQSFAEICPTDEAGNARGAGRQLFVDSTGTLATSSDPQHLVAALGCEDLLIVHTPNVTLVCRRDRAEDVKKLQERVARELGEPYV